MGNPSLHVHYTIIIIIITNKDRKRNDLPADGIYINGKYQQSHIYHHS